MLKRSPEKIMLEYVYSSSPAQQHAAELALVSVLEPAQLWLPKILALVLVWVGASFVAPWYLAFGYALVGMLIGTGISLFLGYLRAEKNRRYEPAERRLRIDEAGFTFIRGTTLITGKWSENLVNTKRWGYWILDKDGQTPVLLPKAVTARPGEVQKILDLIGSR